MTTSTTPDPPLTEAPSARAPVEDVRAGRLRSRLRAIALSVLAGFCIAASVPPWGWWPMAFVGIAIWDQLLANQGRRARFCRSWLVAAAWLGPAMLWMWGLTNPGYVVAVAVYAAYFGVGSLLVPARAPLRWIALPAMILLAEIARWTFPFGGVPLATLAEGQAASPLGQSARFGTAIFVSALAAVGGVALSAAYCRRWRAAAVATGIVVIASLLGLVAPRGHAVGTFTFAIVQGGGPQQTRSYPGEERIVFKRHLDASALIDQPVDIVLWPENVVAVDGQLAGKPEERELLELATRLDAPVLAGVTEDVSDENFTNATVVFLPGRGSDEATVGERYDKVRTVPFGEFVPLRPLVEQLAGEDSGLSARDALPGTDPAVVNTPVAKLAVVISWEVFFTNRARDGVLHGGETLYNPTNGSTYWLTQVQTQQVASSRLRAIETGRWVLQAAPTGFSAVVDDDGHVLQRTDVGERAVLTGTAPRRDGNTIATVAGPMPMVFGAIAGLTLVWILERRSKRRTRVENGVLTAS